VEGVAQATQNVVQGFSGWLSDKLQRRKPIAVAGYALAAVAKPLMGMSAGWPAVLGARSLDRLGSGFRSAPRDALVASSADEASKAVLPQGRAAALVRGLPGRLRRLRPDDGHGGHRLPVRSRFAKIGIPMPEVLVPFVGVCETVCGVLFIFGLLTRLAAITMLIDMLVAISTIKVPILLDKGFWAMAHEARTDWSMLLGSAFLLLVGAGAWSLDAWLARAPAGWRWPALAPRLHGRQGG
jgi:uncharacterized membrane protein YphA (DoxX/SURF4 family)